MVATNGTAELAIIGTRLGQQIIVTHHFRSIQPVTGRPLSDLVTEWQTTSQTAWLAGMRPDYTLAKLRARHVCGSLPLEATYEVAVNTPGTAQAATAPLAPWFAVVVRERTGSAGRSYRGRFFIPLGAEDDFAYDQIVPAVQTWFQAYVTTLQNAYIGAGATSQDWAMVVHSRKLASVPGTQCQQSSTLVESLALQTAVTTQRSRRARPV